MARPNLFNFARSALVSWTLWGLGTSLAIACSSESGDGTHGNLAHIATGTASLPLVTTANGNVYRLNEASVLVCGTGCTFLNTSDDPDETMLSTVLQTGSYQAFLQSWGLQKRDPDGVFRTVQATLVSSSTSFFQVFNGTTTTISYRFQTDGMIVTVGQGTLNVEVDVTETASVCTPLGTDCAEGSWCPPTELTGSSLACLGAGNVALGEPCSTATDCVANASCFDLGAGPVCVALCGDAEFGQPCASAGTCEAAGTTYGLCR